MSGSNGDGKRREPKHVKALIDKHIVQGQLTKQSFLGTILRGVRLRGRDDGGTRNGGREQ